MLMYACMYVVAYLYTLWIVCFPFDFCPYYKYSFIFFVVIILFTCCCWSRHVALADDLRRQILLNSNDSMNE